MYVESASLDRADEPKTIERNKKAKKYILQPQMDKNLSSFKAWKLWNNRKQPRCEAKIGICHESSSTEKPKPEGNPFQLGSLRSVAL
jgi:hypothetical protein